MVNGKLHYNFTALDNLMDRLWENKLIPGKGSSIPPQLATSVCPCCAIIRKFLETFAKAAFDENSLFSYLPLPHVHVNVNSVSKILLWQLRQHKWFYIAFNNSLRCMNWEMRSLEEEKTLYPLTCT